MLLLIGYLTPLPPAAEPTASGSKVNEEAAIEGE